MCVFDEGETFMGKDVDIFKIAPESKMSQQDLVQLGHSVIVVRQSVITDVQCFSFFGKRANALHVLSKDTEPCPSKDVLSLIHVLTILIRWYFMIKLAVDSIRAASPCKEETKVRSSFLIKQISSCIPDIQLRIAFCKCCFFIFFVLGADVLAEPKVVLLVAFFIGVVVRQTGLDLFPGRSLHGISKGKILLLLLLDKLLRDMLVDIVSRICVVLEGSQVGLNSIVKFFGELPNRFVGLGIEVVVFVVVLVEEDLEGADELVDLFGIHQEEMCSYKYIITFKSLLLQEMQTTRQESKERGT